MLSKSNAQRYVFSGALFPTKTATDFSALWFHPQMHFEIGQIDISFATDNVHPVLFALFEVPARKNKGDAVYIPSIPDFTTDYRELNPHEDVVGSGMLSPSNSRFHFSGPFRFHGPRWFSICMRGVLAGTPTASQTVFYSVTIHVRYDVAPRQFSS
jgi:hypothetical protein